MEKALLIEDRIKRQVNYASELSITGFTHPALKNICGGSEFQEVAEKLEQKDLEFLSPYQTIIIHRSSISSATRQALIDVCRARKIALVFFSGGISMDSMTEVGGFLFLNMNANNLYSKNLFLFLDDFTKTSIPNLPILLFGSNWEINLLLSYRHRIVAFQFNSKINTPGIPGNIFRSGINLVSAIERHLTTETKEAFALSNIEQPAQVLLRIHNDISSAVRKLIFPYENFIC